MSPKLFRAAEVCEIIDVRPYVLRSWEKEFPGIGVQKSADAPRFYRPSDVEHVRQIKQLVFGEGLTLAGARRRLEESGVSTATSTEDEVAEVLDALASDARTRIAHVRDGLRSILQLLSSAPGTVVVVDDYRLEAPSAEPSRAKASRAKARVVAKPAASRAARKSERVKRGKRASA